MKEIWVDMDNPHDGYKISNHGNIISPKGRTIARVTTKYGKLVSVNLVNSNTRVNQRIALRTFVARYFLHGYNDNLAIRHIDGDYNNCHVDNLQLFDPTEESENTSLPTRSQINDLIRQLYSKTQIAEHFGLTYGTFSTLISRYKINEDFNSLREEYPIEYLTISDTEEWRPHPFITSIAVSSFGNIREVDSGKYLSDIDKMAGNIRVRVRDFDDEYREQLKVKLVVDTWLPATTDSNLNVFRFKDGDRTNCRVDNIARIPSRDMRHPNPSVSYYEEVCESIKYYLLNLGKVTKQGVCKKFGISTNVLNHSLVRYGFPVSEKKLKQLKTTYEKQGELNQFISGEFNIDKVLLADGEISKPIDGYPGYYVTSHGRIISRKKFTRERELYSKNKGGAARTVKLCKQDAKSFSVARLVANTFLANCEEDKARRIIYVDGDVTNCKVSNLEFRD